MGRYGGVIVRDRRRLRPGGQVERTRFTGSVNPANLHPGGERVAAPTRCFRTWTPQERTMIRTGEEYRDSIRDGREVWINGERVEDLPTHSAFKPLIDIRARIYDLAHDAASRDVMAYLDPETGERNAVGPKLPRTREDWHAKRRAVDYVLDDVGGVVTRVGDETVGEMWSLYDGQDVLNEVDPRFAENIRRHVERAVRLDPFHVSANTDSKGDRSKRPQEQDPDMLLHVVREMDRGIVVRGAKFETAAAYANQGFVKPTIANWGDSELSDYAVGFVVQMGAPGIKHICRTGFAGRASIEDYPLANRFDEIDTLVVFDDVEIPWEDVLFYRHTRAAAYIRATLHRYSAFPFVQRILRYADLLIGAALLNVRQTGLQGRQPVQEKLAALACYREGINAHLTAAVAEAEVSPGGLLMPNQSLLFAGRVLACSQLPAMMHLARDLCGGQICVTPDVAAFRHPETAPWLEKYYTVDAEWPAEERRKLLAFARDLLNSDYAGHRLTFQLFAQSPPFAHLLAVYNNYDWEESVAFARKAARLEGAQATQGIPDQGHEVGALVAVVGESTGGVS
jgi:4-hydroxyphenylacetate 3-monooxygenase